jgi:hypothetical protein
MSKTSRTAVRTSALLAAGVIIVSALALKHWVTAPMARVIVAVLPVPFYAAFLVTTIRHVRQLDGLQQRVSLEAMTFAATVTGLGGLFYGQLETAHVAPPLNAGYVAPALMVLYSVGYFMSGRRYQ